jgi:hypothetical protein
MLQLPTTVPASTKRRQEGTADGGRSVYRLPPARDHHRHGTTGAHLPVTLAGPRLDASGANEGH